MDSQDNKCFYSRFVDEKNISEINNYKESRKYWVNYFSFLAFCGSAGIIPTFIGYNFEDAFPIAMFCITILFFIIALYFLSKILHDDRKYKVIKNKKYFILLSLPILLFTIGIDIAAIFTTQFIYNGANGFEININPFFFLFIYLPLYLGYVLFLYYAFLKCFGKYCRKPKENKIEK